MLLWQHPLPEEAIQHQADITFHFHSIIHTTAAAIIKDCVYLEDYNF